MHEFFRKWISIGFFDRLIRELNAVARDSQGKTKQPTVAVIDSQSIRTGLAQSIKGIDGGKNYEHFLHTAKGIAMAVCAIFMLRFI